MINIEVDVFVLAGDFEDGEEEFGEICCAFEGVGFGEGCPY